MSAETLSRMNPMSQSALQKAQTEDMDFQVREADNGRGTIDVYNYDTDGEHEIMVIGEHFMCDCPAKQYRCDPDDHENCKHEIAYSIRAP